LPHCSIGEAAYSDAAFLSRLTQLFQPTRYFCAAAETASDPNHSARRRWLRLFRPATLDLILTKVMRGDDPQDIADITFLIRRRITLAQIEAHLPS
jgi:hypothetical protein